MCSPVSAHLANLPSPWFFAREAAINERSYHIFYMFCCGVDEEKRVAESGALGRIKGT